MIRKTFCTTIIALVAAISSHSYGETLYNGIELPSEWPPNNIEPKSYEPMPVPYLESPPDVIPINIGRQLFIDDYLIEKTDLKRQFHYPQKYENNPILKPETELESGKFAYGNSAACPKSGGVWWDPQLKIFRMWYEAGWIGTVCYAQSTDGLNWQRPQLDFAPPTNRILNPDITPDSWSVVPDYEGKDPQQKWKFFLRGPGGSTSQGGHCMVSADGIHWSEPVETGPCGDRSTVFYNPFRKKWVFSLRSGNRGRSRHYWEADDFLTGCQWDNFKSPGPQTPIFWTGADKLDLPDPQIEERAQLYNLDAVAYESIMLAFYQIHLGPPNDECMKVGLPKITDLNLAYSRDGFHWHRPDRNAFIKSSRQDTWDHGYVQSVGGICLIKGDKLWFYYIGFQGNPAKLDKQWKKNGMYDRGSTGLAFLRRDGFASMNADQTTGTLTTRKLNFNGKHLFVNVDAPQGTLQAEILNQENTPLPGFTLSDCLPTQTDSTIHRIQWQNNKSLEKLAGKTLKIRFTLKKAKLYAFWISPDKNGASHGYVAAGGPGFTGLIDTVGTKACN